MNERDEPKGLSGGPGGGPGAQEETFEFDGREVDEYDLVPEGRHHAHVIDFQKDTSQSGNDMYVWEFEIVAGEAIGETIRSWTSLLPQARWKVADYLEACGIGAKGSLAEFKLNNVLGSPVIVEVEHSKRDGQNQNDVADIYEPDEDTVEAVEDYTGGEVTPF